MKTLLWFYLLVCCGAAESFTEKSVDLGQNVTLKCEVSVKDVYWFLMKPSEPPVFILRSYSSKTLDPDYSNTTFSKTFSLRYNSSLFIHNISTNELGVYYCIQTQTGSPPDISRGIRLYMQHHSDDNQNKCDSRSPPPAVLYSILAVFVILAVVATVFIVCYCRRRPKTQAPPPVPGVQLHQDTDDPVYTDVQHTVTTRPVKKSDLNSTYALLRPPNP